MLLFDLQGFEMMLSKQKVAYSSLASSGPGNDELK